MRTALRSSKLSAVLGALIVLSIPAALAQSAADVSVNQTAATSCSLGEAVAVSGSLRFNYSFSTDSTTGINTYHIAIASNLAGTGQATQTNYVGDNATFAYDFPTTDSPAQITLQLGSRLFSQGSAPSLNLSQAVNISVDTAGNISANVPSSSTTCAGS